MITLKIDKYDLGLLLWMVKNTKYYSDNTDLLQIVESIIPDVLHKLLTKSLIFLKNSKKITLKLTKTEALGLKAYYYSGYTPPCNAIDDLNIKTLMGKIQKQLV